jgi:kynurenine formamidase
LSQNTVIGIPELEDFERRNGRIPDGAFVIAATGWSVNWGDAQRYRNDLRFPSVHPALAAELLTRNISGLGIDTLSADAGGESFPVHRAILGAGRYLVENVATCDGLPECGATAFVLPMKVGDGTEAPIRLVLGW